MAINLGDVNFRLGADARSLGRAVRQLKDFGNTVDDAADRTDRGARRTEAALRRQENAASNALRSVLSLNNRLRGSDFGAPLVRQANRAWREYNATLTSGTLSATQFQRAQTRFRNDISRTTREFQRLRQEAARTQTPTSGLAMSLQDLSSAAVLVNGPLGGVAARLTTLNSLTRNSGVAIAALVAGIATGVVAFSTLGSQVIEVGRQFAGYVEGLNAVTGSTIDGANALEELVNIADDTGQQIRIAAPNFVRFNAAVRGTVLQGEAAEEIYRNVSLVLGRLRSPAENVSGVFNAFTQIVSKGTVQAEELRNQLGDRLPGAFQIAARAIGVTTAELNDMLQNGEVIASDFLPRFSRELVRTFGLQNVDRIENFEASTNRLRNEYDLFLRDIDRTAQITRTAQAGLDLITGAISGLRANIRPLIGTIGAAGGALLGLAAPRIIRGVTLLVRGMRSLANATLAFNFALLANPATPFLAILGRIAVAAAGAAAGFALFNNALRITQDVTVATIDNVEEFLSVQERLRTSSRETTTGLITQTEAALSTLQEFRDELQRRIDTQQVEVGIATQRPGEQFLSNLGSDDAARRAQGRTAAQTRETVEALNTVNDAITARRAQLERLRSLLSTIGQEEQQNAVNLSREYERTSERVSELVSNIEGLRNIQRAAAQGETQFQLAQDLERARDIIRGLSNEELAQLRTDLRDMGIAGQTAEEQVQGLITSQRELNASIAQSRNVFANQGAALQTYRDQLSEIASRVDALRTGPAAIANLERDLAIDRTVDRTRAALERAGVAGVDLSDRLRILRENLRLLDREQETFNRTQEVITAFSDQGVQAFDRLGSSIVDSVRTGESVLDGLVNTVSNVLADITNEIIRFTITNPLSNALFGGNRATTQNLAGNTGGGAFGSVLSGIGNFFSGFFADGGLVGGRGTGRSDSNLARVSRGEFIVNERATRNNLPLLRAINGGGAIALGGGGGSAPNININIINEAGANTQVETSQRQNGDSLDIDIAFRQIEERIAGQISNGGSNMNRALETRYGLNGARGIQQ